MRACGNIGVANEKSVSGKGVRAGEVQCAEDRWLVRACTDTWGGCGVGGQLGCMYVCVCVCAVDMCGGYMPEDYQRDAKGRLSESRVLTP